MNNPLFIALNLRNYTTKKERLAAIENKNPTSWYLGGGKLYKCGIFGNGFEFLV